MNKERIRTFISVLAFKRHYRPLTKTMRNDVHRLYNSYLNGFEKPGRPLVINGSTIATDYERVVVGDYGAYVEIAKDNMIHPYDMQKGQEWRLDKDYIKRRGLNIKYMWYSVLGKKLYYQLATVKYADYKPGYFYISVLDFD